MPLPLHHLPSTATASSAAALRLLRRRPSSFSAMSSHLTPTILILSAKHPQQTTPNPALHLLVDGVQEPLQLTDATNHPQTFSADLYTRALSARRFGTVLIWSPRLSSTHDLVSQNFSELPPGTVCVADVQFKGRGRVRNVWESPEGCLLFSFTLEMEDGRVLPLLQYVVSLAVTEAVKELCRGNGLPNLDVRIKWPNDLYLNGLKVGGILCTSTYRSKKFNVCAGIGLNLDNEKPTTCLNAVLGEMGCTSHRLKREDVLATFFNKFESLFEVFLTQGFGALEELYCQTWLHSGQKVLVEEKDESNNSIENVEVTIQGLTSAGYLLATGEDAKKYELHPDGNSFDFFKGLVRRKLG